MARRIVLLILLCCGVVLSWNVCAFASYGIDGNLSDWGINPFFDWTPWDSRVDYVEEDWTMPPPYSDFMGSGGYPLGGEWCDIEAFYFDNDEDFIYLAMVSTFPFEHYQSGDIAIGFGDSGEFNYALKTRWLGEGSGSVPVMRLKPGESWEDSLRSEADPFYLEDSAGDDIGFAEVHYWNATAHGLYDEPGTDLDTYVTEAKIGRSLFDGLGQNSEMIRFHNTMECGNDYINLRGDFDNNVIPEPLTLSLVSLGVLGLAVIRRKQITFK